MKKNLLKLFQVGVLGVNPSNLIESTVRMDPIKNQVHICDQVFDSNLKFHVFGFGKAVFAMTKALQDILKDSLINGAISVPTLVSDLPNITTFVAGKNNLPDETSITATDAILEKIGKIPQEDVIIVLISGGGSSLLCKPIRGLTLEDKLLTIRQLVQAGADIRELNTVRKCLSAVKGGGLAERFGKRRAMCLILSDIVGDPLDLIASGPTVPNTDGPTAAMEIIQKHKLELKVPKNVISAVKSPKIISDISDNVVNRIVGSNLIALKKILETEPNCKKILLSSAVEGMVTDIAKIYFDLTVEILRLLTLNNSGLFATNIQKLLRRSSILSYNPNIVDSILSATEEPSINTLMLLMGGETTVKVTGQGVGGRNQELAVLFSQLLYNAAQEDKSLFSDWNVTILCAGTDGIDGPTDVAGAFGCRKLIEEGKNLGLDPDQYLNNNDTYNFLSSINNGRYFVKTGHTGTNVMDLHLLAFYKNSAS